MIVMFHSAAAQFDVVKAGSVTGLERVPKFRENTSNNNFGKLNCSKMTNQILSSRKFIVHKRLLVPKKCCITCSMTNRVKVKAGATYHPNVGTSFQLGVDSVSAQFAIHFQSRSDGQVRVGVQTHGDDHVVSFNLKKIQ